MSAPESLRLIPGRDPAEIMRRAIEQEQPREAWIAVSGGKDSTVAAEYIIRNLAEYDVRQTRPSRPL